MLVPLAVDNQMLLATRNSRCCCTQFWHALHVALLVAGALCVKRPLRPAKWADVTAQLSCELVPGWIRALRLVCNGTATVSLHMPMLTKVLHWSVLVLSIF